MFLKASLEMLLMGLLLRWRVSRMFKFGFVKCVAEMEVMAVLDARRDLRDEGNTTWSIDVMRVLVRSR